MSNPKIDHRDKEAIEEKIIELASTYLPNWTHEKGDAGWAAAQSFAKMTDGVIKRLNRVPDKLFIDFMDRLDFKLNPPLSARVPVTFVLAEGTKENKTVPQHTQVADKKQVLFETEKELSVTLAKLSSFFSLNPDNSDNQKNATASSSNSNQDDSSDTDSAEEGDSSSESKTESEGKIDFLFYNDVPIIYPLEEDTPFYPFGIEPKLYNSFYIASSDIFSKKGLDITLSFTLSNTPEDMKPVISWEYWNGKFWQVLSSHNNWNFLDTEEASNPNSEPTLLAFKCPKIVKKKVNGEENYWIRARLVGGGYGTYIAVQGDYICCDDDPAINTKEYKTIPDFAAPEISEFSIKYDKNAPAYTSQAEEDAEVTGTEGITPGNTLVGKTDLMQENEVEITDELKAQLPDLDKALYLGFDKPFGEGFISLLFVLPKKYWDLYQYLEWSYFSKEGWKALNVKDGTNGLMQTGTCEFIAPLDQTDKWIAVQKLYWLRVKIVEKKLELSSSKSTFSFYSAVMQRFLTAKYYRWQYSAEPFSKKPSKIEACKPDLMAFHPALHTPKNFKDVQVQISAIYLNTIWASQSETIKEEYVSSSDGSPNQKFRLLRPAVKALQVWVKEFLEPEDDKLIYKADEEKGFWVLWSEIGYIYDAKQTDRVFMLDSVSGEVRFGDGNFGLIPPIGKDNIKASYQTGGGKQGNVSQGKIKNLVSTISSIDKIQNPTEASGGSDVEPIESLIKRAPKTLRARGRAITFEDYEILTKESSTDVAKVKAIPNFNNAGNYETNWVTVVIAPYSQEKQPECSEGLIRNVRSYLEARAPMITNVQVISPKYAVIDLEIDIVLKQWDLIPIVKEEAQKKLDSFLHPIYGGYDNEGWEFGTLPCFSDFFALLEKINGVEHIKTLTMRVAAGDKTLTITSEETPVLDIAPYILACSGTHILNMEGA